MIKIASKIFDKRINATNCLIEISIEDYANVAKDIIDKNDFQRKRVKGAQTVYSLLKKDLESGCTIPPIVLAVKSDQMGNILNPQTATDEQIQRLFKAEKLIILDGLQRTYTILDLVEDIRANGSQEKQQQVFKNPLRVEIYLGLNKIGILYRMLTLNTGQTPMSVRHQIEILYSDYLTQEFDGIKLFREIDNKKPGKIGEYKFNDVIEGFNSYLDRDALGLTRSDILENIKNLESLAQENSTDVFKDYLNSFNLFVKKVHELTENWEIDDEDMIENKVFGKNVQQLFTKPQVLSGFGAAIGKLKELSVIEGFSEIQEFIAKLSFETDSDEAMSNLLKKLSDIQINAKKIGNEQRFFFTYFFRELFNKGSDSYLKIDKAIESGFTKYRTLI